MDDSHYCLTKGIMMSVWLFSKKCPEYTGLDTADIYTPPHKGHHISFVIDDAVYVNFYSARVRFMVSRFLKDREGLVRGDDTTRTFDPENMDQTLVFKYQHVTLLGHLFDFLLDNHMTFTPDFPQAACKQCGTRSTTLKQDALNKQLLFCGKACQIVYYHSRHVKNNKILL